MEISPNFAKFCQRNWQIGNALTNWQVTDKLARPWQIGKTLANWQIRDWFLVQIYIRASKLASGRQIGKALANWIVRF